MAFLLYIVKERRLIVLVANTGTRRRPCFMSAGLRVACFNEMWRMDRSMHWCKLLNGTFLLIEFSREECLTYKVEEDLESTQTLNITHYHHKGLNLHLLTLTTTVSVTSDRLLWNGTQPSLKHTTSLQKVVYKKGIARTHTGTHAGTHVHTYIHLHFLYESKFLWIFH